jgi:hypothetical protein
MQFMPLRLLAENHQRCSEWAGPQQQLSHTATPLLVDAQRPTERHQACEHRRDHDGVRHRRQHQRIRRRHFIQKARNHALHSQRRRQSEHQRSGR